MAYPASVGRPVTDRAAALHIGHVLSRVALTGTIVRLGEALPVVFFSSAVDFILPVNCRRSTTAVRAASGTAGKMNKKCGFGHPGVTSGILAGFAQSRFMARPPTASESQLALARACACARRRREYH